jgi:hypothetical protein
MEDFVTFEIAKKLKEKGFKNNCISYYDYAGDLHYNHESNREIYFCHNKYDNVWHKDLVDAPTISQVLKWLREEKKFHISTKPYHCEDGLMWVYEIRRIEDDVIIVEVTKAGFLKEEQAALVGIEYVLNNLI